MTKHLATYCDMFAWFCVRLHLGLISKFSICFSGFYMRKLLFTVILHEKTQYFCSWAFSLTCVDQFLNRLFSHEHQLICAGPTSGYTPRTILRLMSFGGVNQIFKNAIELNCKIVQFVYYSVSHSMIIQKHILNNICWMNEIFRQRIRLIIFSSIQKAKHYNQRCVISERIRWRLVRGQPKQYLRLLLIGLRFG